MSPDSWSVVRGSEILVHCAVSHLISGSLSSSFLITSGSFFAQISLAASVDCKGNGIHTAWRKNGRKRSELTFKDA